MDVRIDEMHTRIDAVDGDSLLTQQVLERIVRAVIRAMADGQRDERSRRHDVDLRSITDQLQAGEV